MRTLLSVLFLAISSAGLFSPTFAKGSSHVGGKDGESMIVGDANIVIPVDSSYITFMSDGYMGMCVNGPEDNTLTGCPQPHKPATRLRDEEFFRRFFPHGKVKIVGVGISRTYSGTQYVFFLKRE